jgi:hypothetical protein
MGWAHGSRDVLDLNVHGATPSETTQLAGVWLAQGPPGPRAPVRVRGHTKVEGVWTRHRVAPELVGPRARARVWSSGRA